MIPNDVFIWLVVWNILEHFFFSYIGKNNPNWRTPSFFWGMAQPPSSYGRNSAKPYQARWSPKVKPRHRHRGESWNWHGTWYLVSDPVTDHSRKERRKWSLVLGERQMVPFRTGRVVLNMGVWKWGMKMLHMAIEKNGDRDKTNMTCGCVWKWSILPVMAIEIG